MSWIWSGAAENAAPGAGSAGNVMSIDSTFTIMSAPSKTTKIRDCGPIMTSARGFSRMRVWRCRKKLGVAETRVRNPAVD